MSEADLTAPERAAASRRPEVSVWTELRPTAPHWNGWPVWVYRMRLAIRAHLDAD